MSSSQGHRTLVPIVISAAALVIASLAWLEPWSSPGAFEAQSIGGESYSGEHDALRAEIDALKEQVQSLQEQLWSLQLASKPTSGGREPPVEVEEEPRSFDFGVMAAYDGAREALERCVREAFPSAESGQTFHLAFEMTIGVDPNDAERTAPRLSRVVTSDGRKVEPACFATVVEGMRFLERPLDSGGNPVEATTLRYSLRAP